MVLREKNQIGMIKSKKKILFQTPNRFEELVHILLKTEGKPQGFDQLASPHG